MSKKPKPLQQWISVGTIEDDGTVNVWHPWWATQSKKVVVEQFSKEIIPSIRRVAIVDLGPAFPRKK